MKKILITLIFLCCSQKKSNIHIVEKEDFQILLNKEVQLIDVRTPNEYSSGFIADAENINFKSKDFLSQISKLDRSKPVLLYCSAGGRSAKASKIFDSLGFKQIYDLRGGYLAW
tara:strand:- start:83625 stop:83966 length:342 start_codon:yes stop_codon:yes gene_type:complete